MRDLESVVNQLAKQVQEMREEINELKKRASVGEDPATKMFNDFHTALEKDKVKYCGSA